MPRLGERDQKKFSLQPPSSHVAHENLGGKWSWHNENADLHSPQGGLGLGMGPLWDPSIGTPARRAPARRRPAPPWPPTEPQIKKMRQASLAAPTTRALGQVVLDLKGPSWSAIPGPRAPWTAAGAAVVVGSRGSCPLRQEEGRMKNQFAF